MSEGRKKVHPGKLIGDVEVCFIPFWFHLVSTLESEGKAKARRRQSGSSRLLYYTKKAKN